MGHPKDNNVRPLLLRRFRGSGWFTVDRGAVGRGVCVVTASARTLELRVARSVLDIVTDHTPPPTTLERLFG